MPRRFFFVIVSVAALSPTLAVADAPKLSHFFPAGASRGQSVQVEAKGTFDSWPVDVWVDRPGVKFHAVENQDGMFEVSITDDVPPGVCWVRLHNAEGATPLRPFLIGTLPEVEEKEPNDPNDEAQVIDSQPVLINGRLQRSNDVDAFAVPLKAGQTLVAVVDANRRFGSPMDGVLQIVSPDGFVIDHVDDAPTLDPKLAFEAPEDGTYIVRVFAFPANPNSSISFAGGDDYVYRLTLTTEGYIDQVQPSAVSRDLETQVFPIGGNLPDDPEPLEVAFGPGDEVIGWHPGLAGFAELTPVTLPIVTESEITSQAPEPISLPAVFCGRISEPGEVDTIPFHGPAGASIAVRVTARSFNSPLDVVVRAVDNKGEQLAEQDDGRQTVDPEVTVKVPDDGIFHLQLRDLYDRGGPDFVYQVELIEPSPDVSLTVEADSFTLTPGKPLEVEVSVDRQNGFRQPVTVQVEGLPESVSSEPVVSEPEGDSSKKVTLKLEASEGADPFTGPILLVGEAVDPETRRTATAERLTGSRTDALWLTVVRPSAD